MPAPSRRVVLGFLAGALAVAIFHQGMYVLAQKLGLPLQGTAWNLAPDSNALGRIPRLFNQMFWGGMWGILFAFLVDRMPAGPKWLRGFAFGMVFPMFLGSWLIVPLIKSQPILAGYVPQRLLTGFLLNGVAFGLGLGILYPLLARMLPSPSGRC